MPNPYDLLELTPDATVDEVRAAYRRRAAQVHPDLQPSEKKAWAAEQMRQLNAARDLLIDPGRRAAFDAAALARRQAPAADQTPPQWQAGFYRYSNLYSDLARERRQARELRRLIGAGALFTTLLLLAGLAIVAPGVLAALVQLIAGLIALGLFMGLSITLPVAVAILLAFIVFTFRNS